MHGPAQAAWLLVALCAATGAYCLLRMRSRIEEQRRTAGGEALMGFGMAVMAVPAAVIALPRWAWLGYAAVFGAAALHALWTARANRHHLHHLVGACAMVYMSLAMITTPGAHAGHGGAGLPVLTGALLLYFAGYVLWSGARLAPAGTVAAGRGGSGGPPALGWGDRPELALACRLSMGIGMLAMLLTL
ncbi:DUF5134 domain-containing protein [Streptomyces sp. WAC 01529]|uniref:DUF5134 domain-containing protein n=1 Tax=Streptomyces sp. WAC 01529 TaxID=2203205 RepID=UPI000F6F3728|nr:DUF5134 domain-containing protein [Streptomyces sp. WAC 01529]AZM51909.1 DUF5134 domain-containing protein [Streptomyces sp. WAC 01529]